MSKGLKDSILALNKQGKKYSEIVAILGCAKSTVSYHCRKSDDYISKQKNITVEDIKEMQAYYNKVNSIRKTADHFDISRSTAHKYITSTRLVLSEEEKKKNNSAKAVEFKKRIKQELIDYKGGSCECCGYDKYVGALEFHHIDPSTKEFTIASKSLSFEKMKPEVDKCVLVCSNCHRELHAGIIDINNIK